MEFFKNLFNLAGPEGGREAMRSSYKKHVRLAHQNGIPHAHRFGLYGALGSRYKTRFKPVIESMIWLELTPFLLMKEDESVEALAEYALYQEWPREAKTSWLKEKINEAISNATSLPEILSIKRVQLIDWYHLLEPNNQEKFLNLKKTEPKKKGIKDLISIIILILDVPRIKLSKKEEELLSNKYIEGQLNNEEKNILGNIYSNIWDGYLSLAIKGHQFINPKRIEERFGASLVETYPEASKSFLNFAICYWTFKIHLWNDFDEEIKNCIAYQLIGTLENEFAALFFPMPGPSVVPSNEREKAQREVLKNFDFDIEDFIRGNPILIRDRKRGI